MSKRASTSTEGQPKAKKSVDLVSDFYSDRFSHNLSDVIASQINDGLLKRTELSSKTLFKNSNTQISLNPDSVSYS